MEFAQELREILGRYEEAVREVEKRKRPMDGLFGLGRSPAQDPCHDAMDREIAALAERAAEEADEEGTGGLVSGLLKAAAGFQGPEYARLSLTAAQRHAIPLISRMSAETRAELRVWYEKAYPRQARFPIQKELIRALGGR